LGRDGFMTIRESDVHVRLAEVDHLGGAEVAVIFHHSDRRLDDRSARLLEGLGVQSSELEAAGLLPTRVHTAAVAPIVGRDRPQRLVLVCLDAEAGDPLTELRDVATIAGRYSEGARQIAVALPTLVAGERGAVEALVEGLVLGRYQFERYRSNAAVGAAELEVMVMAENPGESPSDEAARGQIVADAANWARDLVTTAPADKTPEALAEELRAVVGSVGASVRIWTQAELAAAGFRGILAVAAGSQSVPVMVEIDYQGGEADAPPVALVGKGVTFDSGGLDLKALQSMYTMKNDMGGAAAVAASVYAAGRLSLPINVRAALPLVENMPSGVALRPGDVIRHWNGITSEVVSPDAEGRLIMADAIAYLGSRGAQCLVVVSTMTGATAVGADLWGVFSAEGDLAGGLVKAGLRAGEPGWHLPLWLPYRSYLDSDVADLRNVGERLTFSVSGIVASLFLAEFVPPTIPWAHIDMCATVTRDRLTANEIWPKGATGSPSRALIRWLESMASAA
jgi:leucyl aminopeptidase